MTQQQIEEWNETFPPGSPCCVRHDDGSEHTHHTRSPAWLLGSGHAVVKVDGFIGGYDLARVFMSETHTNKSERRSPSGSALSRQKRDPGDGEK